MNPVYQELIKSVLRKLLTVVATYLLTAGLIDERLAEGLVSETTALILGLILLGWSLAWSYAREWSTAYFKRNLAEAGSDPNLTNSEQVVAKAVAMQKAGSRPEAIEVKSVSNGSIKTTAITMLMAVGLASNIGCGGSNPNTLPDQVAANTALYATDAVRLVEVFQNGLNSYTIQQGGRTAATDEISEGIKERVIPAARQLQRNLRLYSATTIPDLKTVTLEQLQEDLDEYETVVDMFLDRELPEGLSKNVASTVIQIRDLIRNIRNLLPKAA